MELRKIQEEIEISGLSLGATKSAFSKGREKEEEKCDIRTEFQRDRDRIIHCKAFRRMKHKTQVFISPEGDHYRTRLTHTLEVSQIARTIARALKLNEDLAEAIALGHDLGHTPFGHSGEAVLEELHAEGFEHCAQSLRVVDKLEKNGEGLNLTYEVRDGILNHRTSGDPGTLEGKVVQISDKIAYINHDIDDAIRAGILKEDDIPKGIIEVLGKGSSQRINTMIRSIVNESIGEENVSMTENVGTAMKDLRDFMFDKVYKDKRAKSEGEKVKKMLTDLYKYYMENPNEMEMEFVRQIEKEKMGKKFIHQVEKEKIVGRGVCDYIACMTDRYAVSAYAKLFIPSSWNTY